ncbi:MAG: hypothetical protein QXR53_01065 [Candidatus Norongarragalinales archaeon]
MILGILFILFSILFGFAVEKKIGLAKTREEQIFFSIAIGLPLASVVAYASFFAFGAQAHYAALAALAMAAVALLRGGGGRAFEKGWDSGFWLRMAPVILLIIVLFSYGAVHVNKSLNYEVSALFWQDTYYHVNIEKYFAYNHIVPPQDPQYAGVPLNYPFLIDLYSGVLERLEMPFTLAFAVPALIMIIAFFACVYFLAFRLGSSKNAAIVAVLFLFFSGSMSYGMMLEDAQKHASVGEWLENPDRDYAALIENPWVGHIIQFFKSHLARQRASNFGYTVAVVVFIMLFEIARQFETAKTPERQQKRLNKMLFASGVLAGFLPLMREAAFIACVLTAGALFVIYRSRKWAWFFAPALVLGAVQTYAWLEPSTSNSYVALEIGWRALSQNPVDIAWFWVQNMGLPLLLALSAFFTSPKTVRKYYVAFVPLFLAFSMFRFSPDYMNNMKLVNLWQIPTFALGAIALARLFEFRFPVRKGKKNETALLNFIPPAAAVVILAAAILPGALSIQKDAWNQLSLYGRADIEFAKDANAILPPDAVVIAFDGPHAFDLVGRVRMLGFPAVGWVKGRSDWYERATNQYDFYSGKRMDEVIRKYGITHVSLIPSNERRFKGLNETAIRASPLFKLIYKKTINDLDYEIYEVKRK